MFAFMLLLVQKKIELQNKFEQIVAIDQASKF